MIGGVSVGGYDAWQDDQPDDAELGEDCGLMVEKRGWADVSCDQMHAYACQVEL
jgi:hypothetical protein